jgi:hypothetical protein
MANGELIASIITGVVVGTGVHVATLISDLFKLRRSTVYESRRDSYTAFVSSVTQWASLLSELARETDPVRKAELQQQERIHELNVLIPAQARLRLVAPSATVSSARVATNKLRELTDRGGTDEWPDYTAAWRSTLEVLRADLGSGKGEKFT